MQNISIQHNICILEKGYNVLFYIICQVQTASLYFTVGNLVVDAMSWSIIEDEIVILRHILKITTPVWTEVIDCNSLMKYSLHIYYTRPINTYLQDAKNIFVGDIRCIRCSIFVDKPSMH